MENLVLRHHNVDVAYNIISAQFDVSDKKLDICLELEISDEDNDAWPPEILIRLANLVMEDQGRSFHVHDEHESWDDSTYDGRPHGYVYSGFHHVHISAWLDIKTHEETEMVAAIKIETDDIRYYDEQVQDNLIVGTCTLTRRPKEDMWGP